MRKLILLLAITTSLALTSCSSIRWQMGQTSSDFLQANHKRNFELVRTSTEWTVYKWQNNWSYTEQPYFFYFHNDQLYKVDRGMRPSDIVIEHRY